MGRDKLRGARRCYIEPSTSVGGRGPVWWPDATWPTRALRRSRPARRRSLPAAPGGSRRSAILVALDRVDGLPCLRLGSRAWSRVAPVRPRPARGRSAAAVAAARRRRRCRAPDDDRCRRRLRLAFGEPRHRLLVPRLVAGRRSHRGHRAARAPASAFVRGRAGRRRGADAGHAVYDERRPAAVLPLLVARTGAASTFLTTEPDGARPAGRTGRRERGGGGRPRRGAAVLGVGGDRPAARPQRRRRRRRVPRRGRSRRACRSTRRPSGRAASAPRRSTPDGAFRAMSGRARPRRTGRRRAPRRRRPPGRGRLRRRGHRFRPDRLGSRLHRSGPAGPRGRRCRSARCG